MRDGADLWINPAFHRDRAAGEAGNLDGQFEGRLLLPSFEAREIRTSDAEVLGDDCAFQAHGFDRFGQHAESSLTGKSRRQYKTSLWANLSPAAHSIAQTARG
ncbi:hypothetical protein Pden_0976 [Paracoccus denitrificans PD1222]|uniref:Uncharacterized protein n=1 Tax=Paracoccus denitrificans (strain Pd 1222) TaxID=318586 RepID=A1B0P3_PARDP|nr:hypothetical protein Pden_0976 [Paracoccus denitrificans PD1222]